MALRGFVLGLLMLSMYPGMSVEKVWGQSANRLGIAIVEEQGAV